MNRLLWVVLGTASCAPPVTLASASLAKPVAVFPSRAEVEKLPAGPPSLHGPDNIADIDAWQMPAPAPIAPQYPHETTWDEQVVSASAAHGNGVFLSPQLRCAAQEIARFYTVNGGMPDDGLRQRMLLRCESTLGSHGFSYTFVDAPDAVSLGQLEAVLLPNVQQLLNDRFLDPGGEFGLAAARGNGRYVVVALSGHPLAVLDPFSPLAQGSSITLSGELKTNASYLLALASEGALGVARCEIDPMRRLPAFRITCPLSAADASTRIEIASRLENRVLEQTAAMIEVRREEHAPLDYHASAYGVDRPVASSEEFRSALLSELNRARASAGVGPLTLEPKESETAQRLAPLFYQSLRSGADHDADKVALGLLAGWDVSGGLIHSGGFLARMTNTSRSPSRWLTQALDSPLGRFMLLEPGMSQAAIGVCDLSPSGAQGLVTTYAFFGGDDHRSDEAVVLAELDRQRRAHGVTAARRVPSDAQMLEALTQIGHNVTTASSALQNAVLQLRSAGNRQVVGYSLETTDIRQLKLDPLFLDSSTLELEIGITHYRAPGAAWGQYAVLFIVLDHGPLNHTAKRSVTRRAVW